MANICLVNFKGAEKHGYILGSQMPREEPDWSPYLDIGYNHQSTPWRDDQPHYHTLSEEYFIVLQGRLDLLVANRPVSVLPKQLAGIRSGMSHQVVGGQSPIESFLIRVPGGGKDRVLLPPSATQPIRVGGKPGLISLNLQQSFREYPLGNSLPETHANHSALLDFTCAWGVDPQLHWKHEQLHFHSLREEYYIVLRGQLDFAIGSSVLTVHAGQILGVKPETPHCVLGGKGPVDIIFVRVPGGRGDKTVTV